MDVNFLEVNYWAVILAAFVNFLIGVLWYSPLVLGQTWKKEMGLGDDELYRWRMELIYISFFSLAITSTIVMTFFIYALEVDSFFTGAVTGFLIAIGFVATTMAKNALFESRTGKLYLITVSHHIVSFMVMGGIIGAMK